MSSPSLVGGIALRAYDLPGSIAFAAAYGLLLPVLVYRLFDKRWRTAVLFQATAFALERPIIFSLRAAVAAKPNTEAEGLSEYMQLTFAMGYLTLAEIALKLTRVVLVNTTKGSDPAVATYTLPPLISVSSGFWKSSTPQPPSTSHIDDPQRRFWYRRWSEFILALYLVAIILAVLATAHILNPTDYGWNRAIQILRYASSSIGLTIVLLEISTLLWTRNNVPNIDQQAVRFLLVLTALLTVPPLYRLVVMHSTTSSISAPGHQALNAQADKAAFYVLHLLPEFTMIFILCFFNVKEICQTGPKGDERWRDETPKEREKRERKEREKERKKAEAKNAKLEFELKSNKSNTSNDSAATLA